MKIIDCLQCSPEWFAARLGIPTASRFDKIIAPGGAPSKSADGYMNELLAEYLAGSPIDAEDTTHWMERGSLLETVARVQYEFLTDNTVEQVGFCLDDSGKWGCSPDGLIDEKGMLEIKCPKHTTIIEYYRNGFPKKYTPQVQGQMWVTGRSWCDFFAYHPQLKPFMVRVDRDDEYIGKMEKEMIAFCDKLDEAKKDLEGWKL